ncbi:distal membrane-arm assembly complex protein 2 isoform X2 [Ambystoma mexicanum]|uniref:distal membrane-arm assembly complex protein 2 isoform X2 n=1 Tax=Ambystoma mexicanum TaxID=8296 RepID=UPI0037E96616
MAAPTLLRRCTHFLDVFSRNTSTSARSSPKPLKQRILSYLNSNFYDMENIINWSIRLKNWNLRKKNAHFQYTVNLHGKNVAAAFFTLSHRGAVRFKGHEVWYRADKKGKFSYEFVKHKDVPVEAVDLSGSLVNYDGLENIVHLEELKYLNLSNCSNVDDWCLSRLHVFKDTLEELHLTDCPSVTARGLASLHHVENLKHLDVSDLPSVPDKEFTAILLEEILPRCNIVGMNYEVPLVLDSDYQQVATKGLDDRLRG